MDIATLATTATAVLAPHLLKAGEMVLEEAGKRLPEQVGKLWDTILSRFEDKPAAAGAAAELIADPENEDTQEAFSFQLKKTFKEDPEFAEEVSKQTEQIQQSSGITNIGSGVVATGGSIGVGSLDNQGGVSGNITIGSSNTVSQGNKPQSSDKN